VFLDGGQPPSTGGVDQQLGIGLEVATMLAPVVVAAARAVVSALARALADSAVSEAKTAAAAWIDRILHRGEPVIPTPAFSAEELCGCRKLYPCRSGGM
jgi:hypothetical protein